MSTTLPTNDVDSVGENEHEELQNDPRDQNPQNQTGNYPGNFLFDEPQEDLLEDSLTKSDQEDDDEDDPNPQEVEDGEEDYETSSEGEEDEESGEESESEDDEFHDSYDHDEVKLQIAATIDKPRRPGDEDELADTTVYQPPGNSSGYQGDSSGIKDDTEFNPGKWLLIHQQELREKAMEVRGIINSPPELTLKSGKGKIPTTQEERERREVDGETPSNTSSASSPVKFPNRVKSEVARVFRPSKPTSKSDNPPTTKPNPKMSKEDGDRSENREPALTKRAVGWTEPKKRLEKELLDLKKADEDKQTEMEAEHQRMVQARKTEYMQKQAKLIADERQRKLEWATWDKQQEKKNSRMDDTPVPVLQSTPHPSNPPPAPKKKNESPCNPGMPCRRQVDTTNR